MSVKSVTKLFVKVTNKNFIEEIKKKNDNKLYFVSPTNEIYVNGVAYGLNPDTAADIEKLKSIALAYFNDGTENAIKEAIDAVQTNLETYETSNNAVVAKLVKTVEYNSTDKTIDVITQDGDNTPIKVSDIIGNHIVKTAEYDSATQTINMVFEGAESDQTISIDLKNLLDFSDLSGDTTYIKATATENEDEASDLKGNKTIKFEANIVDLNDATAKSDTSDTVTGLVDALNAKTYIDTAVSTSQSELDEKIDKVEDRLDTIEGDGDGSISKALVDAKAYADDQVSDEKTRAQEAENNLTKNVSDLVDSLTEEVNRAKTAEQANATDIQSLSTELSSIDSFWEEYGSSEN